MKRAKKESHELSPCKKCPPPPTSILSPMIRLRFGELSTPCVRTFVIRTTLFSAFMSAKDKTQYKLIARPE